MGRRLARSVIVRNPKTGLGESLEAGTEVPDWAAAQIHTDSVYEPKKKSDKGKDKGKDKAADKSTDKKASDKGSVTEPPPRSGTGSGLDAWKAYAAAIGLAMDEDVKKAAIIAAVDELYAAESSTDTDAAEQA